MNSGNEVFINQIFDPSSSFIVHWNKLTLLMGVFSIFVDPLFRYFPVVSTTNVGISMDLRLGLVFAILRTITDTFLMVGIIVKFRTALEVPGSKVFKRRKLIKDSRAIAVRYLRTTFVIDLMAMLPLPQVYLWYKILLSEVSSTMNEDTQDALSVIFSLQFLPRIFIALDSKRKITTTSGAVMKNAWSGACYNLIIYGILSNVVGASYYQMYIYWLLYCKYVSHQNYMNHPPLEWDQVLSACTNTSENEYGMFENGLKNKIGSRTFIQKYMYCFSWGLKSLSSLGQNFSTSYSIMETTISILINLFGLVLLADLITRMQAAIQSTEEKEEQHRTRLEEAREWMDYHQLPLDLRERVNHAVQSEWNKSGLNDEVMLQSLPMDLRSEIRRHLYLELLCKLPLFADMESQLVEAICQHLTTLSCTEGTYVVCEGDLVRQMLFIFSGQVEISFSDRGNSNLSIIGPGEFCGQELVTWAILSTTSMDNLPSSTRTVKCLTNVEAFALQAYDMKILATEFVHNQEFQRAFKQHYP